MTVSKAKTLSALFRAVKKAAKNSSTSSSCSSSLDAGDKSLKEFVSSLDTSSSSSPASFSKRSPIPIKKPTDGSLFNLLRDPASLSEDSMDELTQEKEVSRERKQKWVFKTSQVIRFNRLIKMCGDKLGAKATMEVFDKLGRETGLKEYNALIALCLENARTSDDEDVALEHISEAFRTFKKMRERGFQVEEETYGPFLIYFIDRGMVEEFFFFCGPIKDGNPSLLPRLGYYEMLLWIGVNNEKKIQELCHYIAPTDGIDDFEFKENYLLALCQSGRKEDLTQLLEIIDIKRISSVDKVVHIFKSLGRLSLESFAEKFLLAFKSCDYGMENISRLILSYASSIPNLKVEDTFLKFKSLHKKFTIIPSSASYEMLITYCCDFHKVHVALDMVNEMCELGLSLSIEMLHRISHACEESYEFHLVRQIYSVICLHNLKPNSETFRRMISLSVKMKDFEGAYAMLNDMKKMKVMPTASIYNAIMAGYFREKKSSAALTVLKNMECEDIKPDTQTFSYLIGNCDCEEDISKYYEEMKSAGIQVTKHVFMALINAYATCGQFEKAKQVLLDKGIPFKSLKEIKSALASALASNGQMLDALNIYKEIKQVGDTLEPKAVISLIEHFNFERELSTLLQLLEELHDPDYWVDACCRIVLHCVKIKDLRSTVDLLKQLKDKLHNDDLGIDFLCDEVFSLIAEGDAKELWFGLALLQAIKDEIGLIPSRKSLDFLLTACTNAKDSQNSLFIWKEYQLAGLSYNILSYLRMYQALLACGDLKSANIMLTKIPTDDPHIRLIIKAYQTTYVQSTSSKTKKKMQKRKGA
ncbi:pentatricopeptide repeat-containing protein At4g21880, mitochondrial-like isoform X3 [Herrania umbratica]|uniref:Pentatricopeptide repeat-containing protein At4g21880, mitochondrial-like isoform X3 n=1 Tax=Herrania umbratica TaxID=108875 RepID=A0A6J1AM18_9ROSI|nr:pentatricopeptide repeat-containing protein At4g21880, mitochondrial-like isoform X3 [Herrania umbratica]